MILHIISPNMTTAVTTWLRFFLIDNFQNSGRLLLELLRVSLIVVAFLAIFWFVALLLSVVVLSHLLLILEPFCDDATGLFLSCGVSTFDDLVIAASDFVPVLLDLLI